MLKKIALAFAVLVAGFLAFAATRPDTYHVERSIEIEAGAPIVFAQLDDFRAWAEWSPWDKRDLKMTKTYEGTARSVGASYMWQGNSEVGKGKMTITERTAPTRIAYRLEFIEPFASVAKSSFALESKGEKATRITWNMDGDNAFVSKVFGIFMDMDAMIGGDFERGLGALKSRSEYLQQRFEQAMAIIKQQNAAAAAKAATAQPDAATTP